MFRKAINLGQWSADDIIYDTAKLSELMAALSAQNLEEMLQLYLTDVDLRLERLVRARAKSDIEACGREAHAIVSMSGNFGAMRASAAAGNLEAACRRLHPSPSPRHDSLHPSWVLASRASIADTAVEA